MIQRDNCGLVYLPCSDIKNLKVLISELVIDFSLVSICLPLRLKYHVFTYDIYLKCLEREMTTFISSLFKAGLFL